MHPIPFSISTHGFSGLTLAHSTSTFRSWRWAADIVIPFWPQTPSKPGRNNLGPIQPSVGSRDPQLLSKHQILQDAGKWEYFKVEKYYVKNDSQ